MLDGNNINIRIMQGWDSMNDSGDTGKWTGNITQAGQN